ncbi:MAG: DUF2288 family protein [Proteobacteria bacterium]|nr:DUF2288 family protein [Pseudomonadota bacterium]
MDDIKAKLTETLGTTDWPPLGPHAKRQALFEVHELPLVDVGLAMVRNRTHIVALWLEQNQLTRPSPERIAAFEADPTGQFESLIVQPYVLFRPIGPET